MKATFIELRRFAAVRSSYLTDDEYRSLQEELMQNPECGDVIKHSGGLRKMRFSDAKRQKGKRGGLRVIYYYWVSGSQFLLFTVYNKDEMSDLTKKEAEALAEMLREELRGRNLK